MSNKTFRSLSLTPGRIALLYFILAGVWIIFTDLLVEDRDWQNGPSEHLLQTVKGLAFVTATTVLLLLLVSRYKQVLLREQALQELLELYSRNGADLVFALNQNGTFQMVSSSCIRLWGYTLGEILHKPSGMFLYAENGASLHPEDLKQMVSKGRTDGVRVLKKDKSYAELECVVEAWHKGQTLWVCRDVTETRTYLHQLINSEKRYRVLFEATPIATWLCHAHTLAFVDVNEATVQQYGYSREELLRMTLADIRPQDEEAAIHQRVQSFLKNYDAEHSRQELAGQIWEHQHKDGRAIYVKVAAEPLLLDGQSYVMVQAQDMTHLLELEGKYQVLLLNSQRDLYLASVEAQEEERQRIAEDLHDNVGQLLAATAMGLQRLEDALNGEGDAEKARRHLASSNQLLSQGIQELRQVTRGIAPPALSGQTGLVAALEKMVHQSGQVSTSQILFHHHFVGEFQVPSVIEVMAYRLSQELLNNSLKHAKAETISIQLFCSPEMLHLQVEDDGKGFDFIEMFRKGKGMGLRNITRRVEAMGGKVEFISSPKVGGTCIHARFPLKGKSLVPLPKLM